MFQVEKVTGNKEWRTDPHMHNHYEIYFLIDGIRNYIIDNQFYSITKDMVTLIKPNILHNTEGMYFDRILINFDETFLNKYSLHELAEKVFDFHVYNVKNNNKIAQLFFDIYEEYSSNFIYSEEMIASKLKILFISLYRIQDNATLIQTHPNKTIDTIIDYLNENYAQEISLDTLSNMFFISKYHLSRLFKQTTGVNLSTFLINIRLSNAVKLLSTSKSLTQIAIETGFSSVNYMSLQFKKRLKMTPTYYRKHFTYGNKN